MPATTASRFGRLLREIRKRVGLSQPTLAASLHVAPATISKIETGKIKPPLDAPFYERLRGIPGFTPAEVTLLLEAREAAKSTGELLAQLKTTLERLRNPQVGSSIEVRRQGLVRKPTQDLTRIEAAKANQDRAILLAHYLKDLGRFAASQEKYVWEVMESLRNMENDLPDELQPIGQELTQTLTRAYAEYLTAMGLEGITRMFSTREQAPQAAPTTVEEEALEHSPEFFTFPTIRATISPLMPPKEVEPGDHRTSPTPDQQQGDPSAAQGTNAPELGLEQTSNQLQQRQRAPKKGDVYDRDRERYSRERLQATAPTLSKLLLEAIANPDDPLSPSAVRALGEFAKDAVKIRGISANSAAREFNAPPDFFIRWAKELGIIPVLLEGTGQGSATILDREKAQEAADTFHEAKRQGIRPSKLHRKMASP
jgi:transcriptional regulator with XRE-family HTH domain